MFSEITLSSVWGAEMKKADLDGFTSRFISRLLCLYQQLYACIREQRVGWQLF